MEHGSRVALTVVGVLLLAAVIGGAAIVGGSVWWVSRNAERMSHSVEAAETAGEVAGRMADAEGCVEPALVRSDECGTFDPVCLSSSSTFLRSCLRHAAPRDGFCDGVPAPTEVMRGSDWIVMFCARHGRPDDQGCIGVVGEIQVYCGGLAPPLREATDPVHP